METPNVPGTDALRFRIELRTRWSDEDNHGVLNNAVYLTLFEEGRHAYCAELGLLDGNRFPFVLAQTNVRYLAPGRGGEVVSLEMGTTRLGRSSLVQAYRLRDAQGAVWCEAEAVLVTIDIETGESRPMTDDLRNAVARYEAGP